METRAEAAGTVRIGGDLRVHRLGFGAMRITGADIWGPPRDPAEARRVLKRAVAMGVNFIDTADSYGPGVSEELIAEALHPYPPDLVIATKGGIVRPMRARWDPDCRPEHLRVACESRTRSASSCVYSPRGRSATSAYRTCALRNSTARAVWRRSYPCRIAITSPTAPRMRSSRPANTTDWYSFPGARSRRARAK